MHIAYVRPRLVSDEPIEPPLGLLSVIAQISAKLPRTMQSLVDAHACHMDVGAVIAKLQELHPDIVGISVMTQGAHEAYGIVRGLRKLTSFKNVRLIAGGIHATVKPEECLCNGFDICVVGEGEDVMQSLVQTLLTSGNIEAIPGVVTIKNIGTGSAPPTLLADLNALHPPNLGMLSLEQYTTEIHADTVSRPALPILGSRGCCNACAFCSSGSIWRRNVRWRHPRLVVNELCALRDAYGVCDFHFYDDDLLLSERYVRELIEALESSNIRIRFTCQATCSSFNRMPEDALKHLMERGLTILELGLESLIPEVLIELSKNQTLADIVYAAQKLERLGITPYPMVMYLCPGETVQYHTMQHKLFWQLFGWSEYVNRYYSKDCVFLLNGGACTPYPGTHLYANAQRYGQLLTTNWSNYDSQTVVFIPYSLLKDTPNLQGQIGYTALAQSVFRRAAGSVPLHMIESVMQELPRLANGKRSIGSIARQLGTTHPCIDSKKLVVIATVGTLLLSLLESKL